MNGVMAIRTYRQGVARDFDDHVRWVSKNVLLGQLIIAGTWPYPR